MTTTTDPTLEDIATTARTEIGKLRAQADEALDRELRAIAATAADDGRSTALRLQRRDALDEIVAAAAWLAGDLIDVLLKVAAETDPHQVMNSDLARRIRKAEIRLELLNEISS